MPLMFDKQAVEAASHPLARILRLIFYKNRISLDDFSVLYADHGQRMGLDPHVNSTNRNNARRAINRTEEMTFRLFHYIILNILRQEVVEIRIVVRKPDGECVVYSNNDPVE